VVARAEHIAAIDVHRLADVRYDVRSMAVVNL
jgi:hypothetical protein